MTADADLIARIEAEDERTRRLAARVEAPAERGAGETALRGVGVFGAGINDQIASAVGAPFDLLNRGLRAVGVPIPEGSVAGSVRSGIRAVTGEPPVPENATERFLYGAGSGLVDAATTLIPAAAVARTAQVGGIAAGAATQLAAQPVLQAAAGMVGGGVGEATQNPLLGMAASVLTPVAAGAAGRVVTPIRTPQSPGRAALVAAAEREGIPLSAGEATGNRFLRNVESQFEQLPFTAARAAADRQVQQQAINRAVTARTGTPADSADPATLQAIRDRLSRDFTDLTSRNNLDASSPGFMQDLVNASDSVRRYATDDVGRHALNRIDDILNHVQPGDIIPGRAYRELDSALSRAIRETQNGDLRNHLGPIRTALRDAMDASISPADQAAWQQARRDYANFMVLRDAVSGAGEAAATGNVPLTALRSAVDRSTGGGYELGQGDLNELARIGQSVLRPVPDSGTAGRNYVNQLLTGGLMTGGAGAGAAMGGVPGAMVGTAMALGLPPALQAAYRTAPVQAYLRNQLMQGPSGFRAVPNVLLQQGTARITD